MKRYYGTYVRYTSPAAPNLGQNIEVVVAAGNLKEARAKALAGDWYGYVCEAEGEDGFRAEYLADPHRTVHDGPDQDDAD